MFSLVGAPFLPAQGVPRALGRDAWAPQALVTAMRDTQSHKLTLTYQGYWWLLFILYWGKGKVELAFLHLLKTLF